MSKRNGFVVAAALTSFIGSLIGLAVVCSVLWAAGCRKGSGTPGITATEIKIGQTMPYSGPASAYGVIGKADQAYFQMLNDKGGINGRKLTLVTLDDGYNPAKTVEQTRKLVEDDGVAFVFSSVGTTPNTAVQPYLNDKQIPQLFVATGANKWADPVKYPWTMGWQPSYRSEARIYGRYLMKEKPGAKVCVLFQNDDFGKDYLAGLKDELKDQYDKMIIKTASYEATDPTVDSQVVTLQAAECDTLITVATPKFAVGVIRKVFDIGWKPLHIMTNVSTSQTKVLKPAGLEKSIGLITAGYLKDPNDPKLADDPGMKDYRAFMKQYLPDVDPNDNNTVFAYGSSMTLAKVLTQCGDDLSRANIMKQATSLTKFVVPVALPGIEVNTGAADFRPFSQLQLARFNGTNFEAFGEVQVAD